MKIVITGGHHTSALPVIEELKKRSETVDVYWMGHKHSIKGDKNPTLEYREITALGITFIDLKAGKIYRTFDIVRLLRAPFGILQAVFYLLKIKPDIILSFGGYLAVPVVFVGWLLGIPSVTHEQTAVVGYANKFVSLFAKRILLTWKESKKYFGRKKTKVVGLPLRSEIVKSATNNFEENLGLLTVYITAGKTGSHLINEAVLNSLGELLQICNVIHQCGDTSLYDDYYLLKSRAKNLYGPGKYNLRKFVFADEIGEAFNKSDLVVGRAGAHMIYELLALKKPALLIPIPWASHNEQFENAKLLVNVGLAKILEEKDLSPGTLPLMIAGCLKDLGDMKVKEPKPKVSLVSNSAELIVDELFATFNK
jgi:UDP-N-acetylglucosamine--N-acetylmuramyl-(pentapeptide) pyrophosphoryl-undecaprenol N-acetylglucosamine transferase